MTPATDTARAVALNPGAFCDRPHVFTAAWAILMQARGLRVDMDRTGPPRHLVVRHAPDSLCDRLRQRIRARAEAIGTTRPAPLILRSPS